MKAKLLGLLPGVRWVPHDIPSQDGAHAKPRTKAKAKSRNPFSSRATEAPHGSLRPRKSTISLTSEADAEVDARTHAQGQSAFFADLPLEIRKIVYEYVMGEEVLHLTMGMKKHFGHLICEDQCEGVKECGCRVLVGGREGGRLDRACVSTLRVCRRMYSEAILHLYRPHTFSLLHLTHLLYLPSLVPQQRLNTIRTLRLRWAIRGLPYLRRGPSQGLAYREDTANWERGWMIMAGMTGVRDLYVVLVDPSPGGMWERNWRELEEKLLEPVKQVRARWCEVVLPFGSCRTDWNMGESGVVLRKPEGAGEEEID